MFETGGGIGGVLDTVHQKGARVVCKVKTAAGTAADFAHNAVHNIGTGIIGGEFQELFHRELPRLCVQVQAQQQFSQALLAVPEKQNEVSGLMIMGLFGGTVFPLLMGFASDAVGQAGAVAVMTIGVIYLFTYLSKVSK